MVDDIPLIEPVVGDAELDNIKQVLESGYMTQGPYAKEFETEVAEYVGSESAVAVTSCTTGLELALEALGVGPGDTVPIPDFTHPATGNAVAHVGAEPVLIDVDPETYNIDLGELAEAVDEETGAVVPVSWGGHPLPTDRLEAITFEHDVPIVEDAACSLGAEYDGTAVGSQFDVSVFSFHPRKVLAVGEAGMITTDDEELERTIRSLKNFGTDPAAETVTFVEERATNFRLSDVLAAIGVAQMEKLEEITARRRKLAHRYTDLLKEVDGVRPPIEAESAVHNFQSYCAFVEAGDETTRDRLITDLSERNIETQIGTYALHETPAFADAKRVGSLDASRSLSRNLLTLPIAHGMTEDDQHRVVEELGDCLHATH